MNGNLPTIKVVASNRPRAFAADTSAQHLIQKGAGFLGLKTLCGRDCSEWISVDGANPESAYTCKRCRSSYDGLMAVRS